MTIDRKTPGLTEQEYQTAIALQSGFPCVYEVDPTQGDKITRIYDCGVEDINDYRKLTSANGATLAEINNWYFTSTRAVSTYTNSKNETALIAGGLNADEGAFLAASNNPSAGQDTFTEILGKAEFDSLGVTPPASAAMSMAAAVSTRCCSSTISCMLLSAWATKPLRIRTTA